MNRFLICVVCLFGTASYQHDGLLTPYCDPESQYLYTGNYQIEQKRCPNDQTSKIITGNPDGVCACNVGYYWKPSEENGEVCVKLNQCCARNESYTIWHNSCPARCPSLEPIYDDVACVRERHPKNLYCKCKKGFVLDVNENCISKSDCPECGPNEWFVNCPSPCPKTCVNRNKNIMCPKYCLKAGCVCRTGYVRDVNGVCIPERYCPVCPENEEYISNPPACPNTCSNPQAGLTSKRQGEKEGCACIEGFVRDDHWVCVPADDCNAEDDGYNFGDDFDEDDESSDENCEDKSQKE